MTGRPAQPPRIKFIAAAGVSASDAMRDGGITQDEVEAVFLVDPRFRVLDTAFDGRPGHGLQLVHAALGETEAGRHLVAFFLHQHEQFAAVLCVRDMDERERQLYVSVPDARDDAPGRSFEQVAEAADYWLRHSLADHWATSRAISFRVQAPRPVRVNLERKLFNELLVEARHRGIGVEALVDEWLQERLDERPMPIAPKRGGGGGRARARSAGEGEH